MPSFGSLFSGVGGLDLGLERAGWDCRWQVEIDEWCRAVLARHWPDVPRWDDAKTFPPDEGWSVADADLGREPSETAVRTGRDAARTVDLICGGFPCQPVSFAGRGLAQADPRWLWPEFARIVRLLRPRLVLVENVPGLLARGMGDVLGDLAASGYDTEWDCIPAAALGAPHLRYRVFIVAYAQSRRWDERQHGISEGAPGFGEAVQVAVGGVGSDGPLADTDSTPWGSARGSGKEVFGPFPLERSGRRGCCNGNHWATEPDVGRVAHGVPRRVDRLRGLGNAVVPQVAEWIGRRLMESV